METTAREPAIAVARPVAKTAKRRRHDEPTLLRQVLLQVLCLVVLATVLFPIIWVFSVSLDPLNRSRPGGLSLIPSGATFESYEQVLQQPTNNPISFLNLLLNSLKVSLGTALISVMIGVFAAYAFSRLRFRGRAPLMLVILAVLMLPTVATLVPLFVLLNSIPRDLEEAAFVDGADIHQTFLRIILPLSMPALAVTAFLGFIAGWTEFYFTSTFLSGTVENHTLALALNSMRGNFASTPWSAFSAFAILVAVPPAIVYLFAQRWITSGLAIGAVKG